MIFAGRKSDLPEYDNIQYEQGQCGNTILGQHQRLFSADDAA